MMRFIVDFTPHYDVKTTILSLFTALLIASHALPASAGKLDDTRRTVRSPDTRHDADDSDDRSHSDDDDDDDDMMLLCLIPFIFPFCLAAWDDDDGSSSRREIRRAHFVPYPYAGGRSGHVVLTRTSDAPPVAIEGDEETLLLSETSSQRHVAPSKVTGRMRGEYNFDLDGIHVPGASVMFDSSSRLGFDTSWRLYLEPLDDRVDKLVMGHLNLAVRVVQTPRTEAHLGMGARLMTDGRVNGGANAAFRLTLFPVRPLVVKTGVSIGNLGYAFFLEGDLSFGVAIHRAELFAGYRGTLIHRRGSTVSFHGPMAGVTAWF